jgi:hypothetical protein
VEYNKEKAEQLIRDCSSEDEAGHLGIFASSPFTSFASFSYKKFTLALK